MMRELLKHVSALAGALAPSRTSEVAQLLEFLDAGRELYASGRTHAEVVAVMRQVAADPPGVADAAAGNARADAAFAAKFPQSEPPPSDDGEGDGA